MAANEAEGFTSIVRRERPLSAISRPSEEHQDTTMKPKKMRKMNQLVWLKIGLSCPRFKPCDSKENRIKSRERDLGVTWRNLTVKGIGADAAINENVGSQFNIPKIIKEGRASPPLRTIIDNAHGCVKPGEMMLTALEYTKAVRALTDIFGLASIVTLYQAGNGIYNLFDKVLVLDEGKQIYYGPMKQARPFMEDLGFICDDSANVADFLTGVTVPTERKIRDDFHDRFPRTADEILAAYNNHPIKLEMEKEYDYPNTATAKQRTSDFHESVQHEKYPKLSKKSPLTTSFTTQVKACIIRQYQIIWGDKATFIIKQLSTLAQALIAGSLFYNAPNNSAGLFVKSGAIFLSLLFNALLAMSEVTESFSGRPVLAKHKAFALYHPAAFCIAQIAADIPVLLVQISHFSLVMAVGAGFSNFDAARYMIQKPDMHPWFVWIYWIDPLAYGFSAVLANEFKGQVIPCVGTNLVPNGPGYTDLTYQACAGVGGALPGAISVTGEQYLNSLSYSTDNIWRNFGILWAWWAANAGDEESGTIQEKRPQDAHSASEDTKVGDDNDDQLIRNTSVFTWKNLTYTVKTPSGDRVLLDNVQGWVKPGMLGALMGSSGAGKTTLLDVLAQRKTDGTIKGSILVDGRPLSVSFQRSAGYCEQLDVHEPFATVREALEFSALLRQSRTIPEAEKLRYVDTIIDLLEMHDIENTLIGTAGAGLSIEQRKRLTIGVELVSKPSILIFLDEPTSGLDGQAAFNTVRFLRKLADVGQAILVTIHQPSAQLFAQFDSLLLLAKGGKTVYFGDIGENSQTIKEYFARYDAPCPESSNPAEHMIDVVSGSLSKGKDWHEVWLNSPEYQYTVKELDRIINTAAAAPPGTADDGFEFAMPMWQQIKLVTNRMNVSIYRNTEYINNKLALHIGSALFNGFSFWMVKESVGGLQLRLFTIFNFIFVAPGVMAQLQPLFIERRDIYEVREKKSKMYSWWAFAMGNVVSELPYLCICAVLYFVCWYYTVGFPSDSNKAGAVLFVMICYEFIYTGIGQFRRRVRTQRVSFCGVLVPYAQITAFWRYWMYYLNPFNYLMGSLLVFTTWDTPVRCRESEFAIFNPANGTCGEYLSSYLQGMGAAANLTNPDATSECRTYSYGWRDAGICALFVFSGYALVFFVDEVENEEEQGS
ncbi:hypothetical protein DID88_009744 [Monilinia fructigena]|uniref:ABC transporter domain-containing protein n=1 Tax=Monilinia fructigena TaxID=38457 RepID=A0A395ILZ1_9HELO|nr:hypothetical protein DID88_009744 [Monilinia fructigena]